MKEPLQDQLDEVNKMIAGLISQTEALREETQHQQQVNEKLVQVWTDLIEQLSELVQPGSLEKPLLIENLSYCRVPGMKHLGCWFAAGIMLVISVIFVFVSWFR